MNVEPDRRPDATPGREARRNRTGRRVRGWEYVVLSVAVVIILGPFLVAALTSLRTNADYVSSTSVMPTEFTLSNYVRVFEEIPMGRMILNGLLIAVLGTFGGLVASLVGAFCFAKLRFAGREPLFGVVLFTMLVPSTVTLIPLYTIIRAVGLVDSPWALILPACTGSAFAVFFLRQHLMSVPHEFYEAAALDGCSVPGTIFRVYLPLVRGPLAILAILNFLASWNDLLGPLIYLNTPEKMTPTVGLTYFRGQYTTDFPVMLAGSLVVLVPTTIIFLVFNRHIRDGLAISGSLK
ncbi:carbohydrate ABC transporter permease [Dactylosporangium fulvum]|uniref:Carbohydrate ABC transporter permease n=1 Tax=Dactylosporangium fulvum TaxID=53359 RepID=A0ABY5WDT9_9ACTN|nr:carbohydrate ABC transporter permease [Dactylosporangium fulvum]UWP86606.1 carbohydrate ABC transporter permease [Dactylosporangium fulvum]